MTRPSLGELMELISDIAGDLLLLAMGIVIVLFPVCLWIILSSDGSPRRRGKKVKRGRPPA